MRKAVLSLGAGVQSTTLYLWALDAEYNLLLDAAVFADTGDELKQTYEHLRWMEELQRDRGGPPIYRGAVGTHLSVNLIAGMSSAGHRSVSIPAHLVERTGQVGLWNQELIERRGMGGRQCTQEFKLRIIEQTIRRKVYGLDPGRPIPTDAAVVQYIGFSRDEAGRARRNANADRPRGWSVEYPLIERGWSREDCIRYLRDRVPHQVERSACVFCPYRSNQEWQRLRDIDPEGFARAVRVDDALRDDAVAQRRMKYEQYVHPDRIPLKIVDFSRTRSDRFHEDCIGGCGT